MNDGGSQERQCNQSRPAWTMAFKQQRAHRQRHVAEVGGNQPLNMEARQVTLVTFEHSDAKKCQWVTLVTFEPYFHSNARNCQREKEK
jgi:hypothetical protein